MSLTSKRKTCRYLKILKKILVARERFELCFDARKHGRGAFIVMLSFFKVMRG